MAVDLPSPHENPLHQEASQAKEKDAVQLANQAWSLAPQLKAALDELKAFARDVVAVLMTRIARLNLSVIAFLGVYERAVKSSRSKRR